MRSITLPTLLLMTAVSTLAAPAQERLLVAEKGQASLAIVDPQSGKVLASVPEGGVTGHEVIASADGRTAFVPIYGNSGVGKLGTDGQLIVAIDIASQKVVNTLDFGRGVRPHCPLIGPKDGLLYVTTELDKTISLIDPKTLKIVGTIPTGQPESHMLVLSHDGLRGYTANVGPGTVSVLDIHARKTIKIISDLGEYAAHRDFARRSLGVYSGSNQAPACCHRHEERCSQQVDSPGGNCLRNRGHTGRPLAAGDAAGPEQDCRRRPADHEGGALGADRRVSAGNCGAA